MLKDVYEKLYARYGDLNWWPAKTPYEVIVGAILTQNTAWVNVEKALLNLEDMILPEVIFDMPETLLKEKIRPAGFFNQKTIYLKEITKWFKKYDFSVELVQKEDFTSLRKELLSVKGVGRETADSILLYAFEFPTFVIDTYTKRLISRLGLDIPLDYELLKQAFEAKIEKNVYLYNNFHGLIVINAKEHCKKSPVCAGCPLGGICIYGNQ